MFLVLWRYVQRLKKFFQFSRDSGILRWFSRICLSAVKVFIWLWNSFQFNPGFSIASIFLLESILVHFYKFLNPIFSFLGGLRSSEISVRFQGDSLLSHSPNSAVSFYIYQKWNECIPSIVFQIFVAMKNIVESVQNIDKTMITNWLWISKTRNIFEQETRHKKKENSLP